MFMGVDRVEINNLINKIHKSDNLVRRQKADENLPAYSGVTMGSQLRGPRQKGAHFQAI